MSTTSPNSSVAPVSVPAPAPSPTSYTQAAALIVVRKLQLKELVLSLRGTEQRLYQTRTLLATAIHEEKFDAAAAYKTERELRENAVNLLRAQVHQHNKQITEAIKIAADFYFKDHGSRSYGERTICHILVADPATHDTDEAVCFDMADRIVLSLSGQYFNSSAIHVFEWAAQHGFLVKRHEASITF